MARTSSDYPGLQRLGNVDLLCFLARGYALVEIAKCLVGAGLLFSAELAALFVPAEIHKSREDRVFKDELFCWRRVGVKSDKIGEAKDCSALTRSVFASAVS